MTKSDLVDAICRGNKMDRDDVLKCVEEFMTVVKDSLTSGENVYLRGFGTFQLKVRREKIARKISEGKSIVVPEHNIPFFKPCDEFKALVANK